MKIALATMTANVLCSPGGAQGSGQRVRIAALAQALAAAGHAVTVYMRRADPTVPARLDVGKFAAVQVDAGVAGPLSGGELTAAVAQFEQQLTLELNAAPPHVVHAFDWLAGRAAIVASGGGGRPVVVSAAPFPSIAAADDGSASAIVIRRAARIIANSSAQVFTLLGLGARPGAIKFVPSGVDVELFAPVLPIVRSGKRFRIATLGGLGVAHGVADVIEALAELSDVELAVGGGDAQQAESAGDDVARLWALARRRGVADRVTFYGRIARNDVPAFLCASDVVVCAPHAESLGLVALEAMACGVPPVVSAVGGLVDAVSDGMTGIHVPPQSPRQIAYAVDTLRADPVRRARYGRMGIERAASRCWPRIAAATLDVYDGVAPKPELFVRTRS